MKLRSLAMNRRSLAMKPMSLDMKLRSLAMKLRTGQRERHPETSKKIQKVLWGPLAKDK
jgi:hypothetical protein